MNLGREPIQWLFWSISAMATTCAEQALANEPRIAANTTEAQDSAGFTQAAQDSGEPGSSPRATGEPWPIAQPAGEAGGPTHSRSSDAEPDELEDANMPPATMALWQDHALAPASDEPPAEHRHHGSPDYSLWLGAGLGWIVPFGDLWGTCVGVDAYGRCTAINSLPTNDVFGMGPAFNLDFGIRLARNYILYGTWERSWLAAKGRQLDSGAEQGRGESDFLAVGLRAVTNPDATGFVIDVAVGTRRMRARWDDGTELQFTDAPFESRLGFGVDVRLDENWTFSPLLALGVGSFGKAEWLKPDGTLEQALVQGVDTPQSHAWLGLQAALHADLLGTK